MSEALSRVGELALVICLIYGLALLPTFAAWTSDLNTGLISYYKTDETSGSVVGDSLNTNNGTIYGATVNQAGIIGKTYIYDTDGDHSNLTKNSGLNLTGNFTISAWVKLYSLPSAWDSTFIHSATPTTKGYMLYYATTSADAFNFFAYGLSDTNIVSTTVPTTNQWYHIVVTYNGTRLAMWINGTIEDDDASTGAIIADTKPVMLMKYDTGGHTINGSLDEIGFWNVSLTPTQIAALYNSGAGITYSSQPAITLSALNTPVASVASALLNITSDQTITDVYWNFGDGATNYSTAFNITHNYTTAGYYTVNATVTIGAANYTSSNLNLTVYSPLSALVITPASYVPFLATSAIVNLTETRTGGTPYSNTSWTFTLSNGSVETATARNQTYYEKTAQAGIYQVSATACDVPSGTCASNTTSFNAWNITGGKTLHTPFNNTSDSIASIYENDCLDLTSTTSLTWNYNNSVKTGTTTEYCFNSSNAFWSNSQYAHHRVYANISWESQTYQTNFTVVTAKYNTSQDGVCGYAHAYKLLVGKVYNEDTFTEIVANHTYVGLLALTTGYEHEQDVGLVYTGQTLNTTLCLNATPLAPFYLDGVISYSSSGYVTRTYAWDNASMTLYATESAANGNLYYFYTTANTTTTATIDITVIRAGDYVDGAIVKAMAYNNNTLTWVTVQSAITNAVGAVTFELENCPTYYKFMVDLDGETIYSGGVECISGTSYTITILSDELEEFEIDEGITTSCAYSNITNYLICTVSDGTGKVISSELVIKGWATMTEYCDTSEESSSTTLICDTSTYDAGLYSYFLEVTTSGYTYSADSGIFQVYEAPTEFYDSNFVFGFLAVGVLAMIPMSGVIKVVAITFMMFVMNVVGLISIPGAVLPYLIGIGLIIIYELAKGGK